MLPTAGRMQTPQVYFNCQENIVQSRHTCKICKHVVQLHGSFTCRLRLGETASDTEHTVTSREMDLSYLVRMVPAKILILRLLVFLLFVVEVFPHPQSYEHNHVRIHIPVYKHTRLHTRTVVKKIPIPVPVPVPVHHKEEHHTFNWPEKIWHGRGHSLFD